MKNSLIILFLIPIFSAAQIHTDLGMGIVRSNQGLPIETNTQSSKFSYLLNISVGYTFHNITVDGVFLPTFTNGDIVNTPRYFGGKVGYLIDGFNPSIGYYYNYCNSDNPENNGWTGFGYSLQYNFILGDDGGFYIQGTYLNKSILASVGTHIKF